MDKVRPYYASLDGMRAISIIAVLIYHSGNNLLKGGFLGVETFFVISGFIITTLLLKEYNNSSTINLPSFYKRRIQRIFPNMFAMIALTLFVVAIAYPQEIRKTVEDILPGMSFTSNWYYIISNKSYFEIFDRPRLLEHLWSLAVEFQYYLIWPFICFVIFKWKKRNALTLLSLGTFISTGLMAYLFSPQIDTSRIYFGTDTRASALIIGSALAILYPQLKNTVFNKKTIASFVAIFSFVGVVLCYFYFDNNLSLLYSGGFLVVAFLSALCIGVCLQNEDIFMSRMLGSKIMTAIGRRAYNIYIWHWPVFCLTQPEMDISLTGWKLFVLRMFITLALSEIGYSLIDFPIQNGFLERFFKDFFSARMIMRKKVAISTIAIILIGVEISAIFLRGDFDANAGYNSIAAQQKKLIDENVYMVVSAGSAGSAGSADSVDSVDSSYKSVYSKTGKDASGTELSAIPTVATKIFEQPINEIKKYPMITYDSDFVDFEMHFPEINGGVTSVPVRYLKNIIGFSIDWNKDIHVLTLSKADKVIYLDYINKKIKLPNEEWIPNANVYIKDDLAYMPLALIARTLAYSVSMFVDPMGYPIVRIISREDIKISDNDLLLLLGEKHKLYLDSLKSNFEEACNAFKVSVATEGITLERWQEIGTRLKLTIVDTVKQNLTVLWSNDINGEHNWENVPYTVDMSCPYWYSWDVGEHQVSAKIENSKTSKIITTTIKVIPKKELVNAKQFFKSDLDSKNGWVTRIYPADEKNRRYLAIGDSVMLGAANRLYGQFGDDINLDAKVSRQFSAAKDILIDYKNKGILGDIVILHLGNNSPIGKSEVTSILDMLKDCKKIFLINLKLLRGYEESNNSIFNEVCKEYKNVEVIDWHGSSFGSNENFGGDGIHLTNSGAKLYTNVITNALNKLEF